MKIAFIVGEFPSLSETFILNQITGLIDLGHNVEIFAQEGNFNGKIHPNVLNYNLKKRIHYFNIPPHRIKRITKAILFLTTNFYRSPIKILKSLNIFKYGKHALSLNLFFVVISFLDKNFDIIYCHFGHIGNMGVCLKQIGINGKLITAFHGVDMRMETDKGKNIYRNLFNIGDKFLVASDYGYKKLLQFGADSKKINLHPYGIDVNKFSRQLPAFIKKNNKVRILTVARLVEEKGLEYSIKAMRELLNNNLKINLEYRIIGGGYLEIPLKKLVKKLGLTKIIYFLGPMTQGEAIQEMKKAHIFFLPSISESFPVVLLEAQAIGLSIVATKVGGIPENIVDKKSGFLVPARDIKAMAKKIEYLIRNPEIRLQMGTFGRKRIIKNYDINKLNSGLIKIFQSLVANNV